MALTSNDIIQSIDEMYCELVVVFRLCYGVAPAARISSISAYFVCIYVCDAYIYKHVIASYTIVIKLNGDDKNNNSNNSLGAIIKGASFASHFSVLVFVL